MQAFFRRDAGRCVALRRGKVHTAHPGLTARHRSASLPLLSQMDPLRWAPFGSLFLLCLVVSRGGLSRRVPNTSPTKWVVLGGGDTRERTAFSPPGGKRGERTLGRRQSPSLTDSFAPFWSFRKGPAGGKDPYRRMLPWSVPQITCSSLFPHYSHPDFTCGKPCGNCANFCSKSIGSEKCNRKDLQIRDKLRPRPAIMSLR